MSDIVAIGEPMVEFNQQPGTTSYRQGFGGDTSNFACAAARAGARVAYLTRVGDDAFGQQLLTLWRREQVDIDAVEVDPQATTGIYFVTHGPDGHQFSYRRAGSAACRMRVTDTWQRKISGARYLHVSGISQAISSEACDAVLAAVAIAHEHGVHVGYDLNYRSRLWPAARARAIALATLAHTDLFLPSLDEAQDLFGISDVQTLIEFSHRHGAKKVALKMGAKGAIVSDGRRRIEVEGFPVTPVDATGAGDCFAGVLTARLAAGDDLALAATAACAAAALSTTGYGAVDPLPDWAAIQQRMSSRR